MITKAHIWFEDGRVDFDYGYFYDIPLELIKRYKEVEQEFDALTNKIHEYVDEDRGKKHFDKIIEEHNCPECNSSLMESARFVYCKDENCKYGRDGSGILAFEYDINTKSYQLKVTE